MTLPKRGRRSLIVDGHAYGWTIRRRPTYAEATLRTPMTVAIERDGAPSILHCTLGVDRPDNWVAPHGTGVTPRMVRAIVEAALAAGWSPDAPGTFAVRAALVKDTVGETPRVEAVGAVATGATARRKAAARRARSA